MSCNQNLQKKLTECRKRALRKDYNELTSNFEKLVTLEKSNTMQTKTIITLFMEVFKATRGENPSFMNEIFSQKRMNYQLRTTNLPNFPKVTGSKYSFNTFGFKSQILSNVHPLQNVLKLKYWKVGKWLNAHAVSANEQKILLKFCKDF